MRGGRGERVLGILQEPYRVLARVGECLDMSLSFTHYTLKPETLKVRVQRCAKQVRLRLSACILRKRHLGAAADVQLGNIANLPLGGHSSGIRILS